MPSINIITNAKKEQQMHIEHVAVWCQDLELMRDFYQNYFAGITNDQYSNARGFHSYFLTFSSGSRLELMQWQEVSESKNDAQHQFIGLGHLAFALGNRAAVDALTRRLQQDGYTLLSGPRTTGDGYYESCFLDPELNRIELTI
jgi:lactoylglutathione lyase